MRNIENENIERRYIKKINKKKRYIENTGKEYIGEYI